VFDDVTPLVRTQRVAVLARRRRRLAHEIKNPLTPIQFRRAAWGGILAARPKRPAPSRECTSTIVGEVIAQGAGSTNSRSSRGCRRRGPCLEPECRAGRHVRALQRSVQQIRIERQFPRAAPVRLDVEQIRRVVINLVTISIESHGGCRRGRGRRAVPERDIESSRRRERRRPIVISDNGPGVPAADREKLFMPYYSTKGRGERPGPAIVRRIVAEHGGSIEVGDKRPQGSRFVIELPC